MTNLHKNVVISLIKFNDLGLEKKKTLIIADIHRLLVFVRETKMHSSDIVISSKNSKT